ncbi:putative DNA-binding protein, major component of a nucleoprotein com [Squirrelpox virus]|uniref:A14R n=1 Tax=Squirrelpox virus TaxID=240426 RepID=Q1HTT0_9POXV|nr:putative DNA-binding protein, major component of a nucleoprotein com [Squirrelpox virus]ABD51456.1 A14R [Squirrelpox virus]CCD83205.1 putative DNA-binding protein, major component of a nucleoprotein com [Squirrelpox virus]
MNSGYVDVPFIVNTVEGRLLVLKAVKICNVRTVEQSAPAASCVLKLDQPDEGTCKALSPPGSPRCERPDNNGPVPFMRTNLLESVFNTNRNSAAKLLG